MLLIMWTVTINDDKGLMLIKTGSVFDYRSLRELLDQIYVRSEGKHAHYNRFVNLTGLETIDVEIDTVAETAKSYRQLNRLSIGVKIAFLSPFGMTGSLAQIYKFLTETDKLFDVQIFHSIKECAEYLQVDQSILA